MLRLLTFTSILLFSSCFGSYHNIKNDFLLKKHKFENTVLACIDFKPAVFSFYDEASYYLLPYFSDTSKYKQVKTMFYEKLFARNIIPNDHQSKSLFSVSIDSFFLEEYIDLNLYLKEIVLIQYISEILKLTL